ncbi:hypothetical protein AAMO2058_001136300 [Amorphochlora amoebiformis]
MSSEARLLEVFRRLDGNNDGFLSPKELLSLEGAPPNLLEEVKFSDKGITFPEFFSLLKRLNLVDHGGKSTRPNKSRSRTSSADRPDSPFDHLQPTHTRGVSDENRLFPDLNSTSPHNSKRGSVLTVASNDSPPVTPNADPTEFSFLPKGSGRVSDKRMPEDSQEVVMQRLRDRLDKLVEENRELKLRDEKRHETVQKMERGFEADRKRLEKEKKKLAKKLNEAEEKLDIAIEGAKSPASDDILTKYRKGSDPSDTETRIKRARTSLDHSRLPDRNSIKRLQVSVDGLEEKVKRSLGKIDTRLTKVWKRVSFGAPRGYMPLRSQPTSNTNSPRQPNPRGRAYSVAGLAVKNDFNIDNPLADSKEPLISQGTDFNANLKDQMKPHDIQRYHLPPQPCCLCCVSSIVPSLLFKADSVSIERGDNDHIEVDYTQITAIGQTSSPTCCFCLCPSVGLLAPPLTKPDIPLILGERADEIVRELKTRTSSRRRDGERDLSHIDAKLNIVLSALGVYASSGLQME